MRRVLALRAAKAAALRSGAKAEGVRAALKAAVARGNVTGTDGRWVARGARGVRGSPD